MVFSIDDISFTPSPKKSMTTILRIVLRFYTEKLYANFQSAVLLQAIPSLGRKFGVTDERQEVLRKIETRLVSSAPILTLPSVLVVSDIHDHQRKDPFMSLERLDVELCYEVSEGYWAKQGNILSSGLMMKACVVLKIGLCVPNDQTLSREALENSSEMGSISMISVTSGLPTTQKDMMPIWVVVDTATPQRSEVSVSLFGKVYKHELGNLSPINQTKHFNLNTDGQKSESHHSTLEDMVEVLCFGVTEARSRSEELCLITRRDLEFQLEIGISESFRHSKGVKTLLDQGQAHPRSLVPCLKF
ncbi:hypothetical protein Tco_0007764 [Tanacetum coccineum]